MVKIYLDPGHGGSDPGAVGNGLREKDLTLKISLKIRDMLIKEYDDISVRMSRTGDSFPTLSQRTSDANKWGADYFLSVHINAGGGFGFESFVYPGSSAKSKTYQNIVHAEIMKLIGIKDRGKKQKNLHVVRETNMPAILTECGFIDSTSDANKMKDNSWLDKVARGHANGIASAFGLKKNPGASSKVTTKTTTAATTNSKALYRVQVGAFSDKKNADKLANELKSKGYSVIVKLE